MKTKTKYVIAVSLAMALLAPSVLAQSTTDIQAQIAELLQRIKQLQAQLTVLQSQQGTAWCHTFNTHLKYGDANKETIALILALKQENISIVSQDTSFNSSVESAVTAFQEKYKNEILTPNGLTHGTGYVGPSTRKKLNQLYGCGVIAPRPSITPSPAIIPFPVTPLITTQQSSPQSNPITLSCDDFTFTSSIGDNEYGISHIAGKCFPPYFYKNEGYFLESNKRPLPIMGQATGHFNVLVVFFDTQQNRDLLSQNTFLSQAVKNQIGTDIKSALTQLFASYTPEHVFSSLHVRPSNISFTFTVRTSSRTGSTELARHLEETTDFSNYGVVLFIENLYQEGLGQVSGLGVGRWPVRMPLFNTKEIYAFQLNPKTISSGLFYNELFRRNVPVLLSEYTQGQKTLIQRDGYTYDETPIYNPRTGRQLSRQDQVLLSSILSGWYDVDQDGIQDGSDSVIIPTTDNVDSDLLPDYLDPDLSNNNGTFFWKVQPRT